MQPLPKSAAAIKEIGNIIVEAAFEQVAKEAGITRNQLILLMTKDVVVAQRVKDYITSGYNFAMSKM